MMRKFMIPAFFVYAHADFAPRGAAGLPLLLSDPRPTHSEKLNWSGGGSKLTRSRFFCRLIFVGGDFLLFCLPEDAMLTGRPSLATIRQG